MVSIAEITARTGQSEAMRQQHRTRLAPSTVRELVNGFVFAVAAATAIVAVMALRIAGTAHQLPRWEADLAALLSRLS